MGIDSPGHSLLTTCMCMRLLEHYLALTQKMSKIMSKSDKIHSFIQVISIAPLQVHFNSKALIQYFLCVSYYQSTFLIAVNKLTT